MAYPGENIQKAYLDYAIAAQSNGEQPLSKEEWMQQINAGGIPGQESGQLPSDIPMPGQGQMPDQSMGQAVSVDPSGAIPQQGQRLSPEALVKALMAQAGQQGGQGAGLQQLMQMMQQQQG